MKKKKRSTAPGKSTASQIVRTDLLNSLLLVQSGTSTRGMIEQSSCVIIEPGKRSTFLRTFNDEIACSIEQRGMVPGTKRVAVPIDPVIQMLQKLTDREIGVSLDAAGNVIIKGKSRRVATFFSDTEVTLPVHLVDPIDPDGWNDLPNGFVASVGRLVQCAGADSAKSAAIFVKVASGYAESTDNNQAIRIECKFPCADAVFVRASSLGKVTDIHPNEVAITDSWVHFRNSERGVVVSIRLDSDVEEKWPDLGSVVTLESDPDLAVELPTSLNEAIDRAAVFSSENANENYVKITITDERISLASEGSSGTFSESKKSDTWGQPPIEFQVKPDLLQSVIKARGSVEIHDAPQGKLMMIRSRSNDDIPFTYVVALEMTSGDESEDSGDSDE